MVLVVDGGRNGELGGGYLGVWESVSKLARKGFFETGRSFAIRGDGRPGDGKAGEAARLRNGLLELNDNAGEG